MEPRELLIGLTYDLRDDFAELELEEEELAEFDQPETIDALEGALSVLGHKPERIGSLHALVARLHGGARWDLVFNIAEGRSGFGREAQVPALLDGYGIAYTFSDPLACAVTLHKPTAKRLLRDSGLPTPAFAVVGSMADLARVQLTWPLFAKPAAEGTSKGIDETSLVRTEAELARTCERLLARFRQPVLVEEYLPGRELTVGILGSGDDAAPVGAIEVDLLEGADRGVYSFKNKERCEELVRYTLVKDAFARSCADLAVAAWRSLGCRDGGRVDLRADASGAPHILEVNPLPGMHPTHSDLPILWQKSGRSYVELIEAILTSALQRVDAGGARICAC